MSALIDAIESELDAANAVLDAASRRVERLQAMRRLALDDEPGEPERAAAGGVGEGAGTIPVGAGPTGDAIPPAAPVVAGALPRAADTGPARNERRMAPGRETSPISSAGRNGAEASGAADAPGSGPSRSGRPARTTRPRSNSHLPALLNALETLGEATASQIADRLGTGSTTINAHLRDLRESGQVTVVRTEPRPPGARPGRGAAVYALKATADRQAAGLGTRGKGPGGRRGPSGQKIRDDVLQCIREGAGLVDEPEIAAQLDVDREHVAEACGQLLEEDAVALNPDGTYTATGGGPMVDQLHQALAQLGRPADQAELEHLLHAPDLLGALNDLTEAGRARRTDRDGLVPVWEVTP